MVNSLQIVRRAFRRCNECYRDAVMNYMKSSRGLTMIAVGILGAAGTFADSPKDDAAKQNATATNSAIITDTGSTNLPGMRVLVLRNGHANVAALTKPGQLSARERRATVSDDVVHTFFLTLDSSGALDKVKSEGCVKSVSFGSSLYVEYRGHKSPDLNCGADALSSLKDAAQAVLKEARK